MNPARIHCSFLSEQSGDKVDHSCSQSVRDDYCDGNPVGMRENVEGIE